MHWQRCLTLVKAGVLRYSFSSKQSPGPLLWCNSCCVISIMPVGSEDRFWFVGVLFARLVQVCHLSIRCSIFKIQNSIFDIPYSIFLIRYSIFKIQDSKLLPTVVRSLRKVRYSIFNIQYSIFILHCSLFSIHSLLFTAWLDFTFFCLDTKEPKDQGFI